MRFGYSTNAFVKFTLLESVEKIANLGFRGLEIMCDRPHMYPPDFDEAALSKLKKMINGLGLKITNMNSFTLFAVGDTYLPSWIEPERERREIRIQHTLQCLKIADYLGCTNISVPPGGPLNGASRQDAIKLFHEGLEEVIPTAESLGVKILIEPEPELLLENSSQFASFIREVQSDIVGLNFDMGHFFCVGEDPRKAFEKLFPWVGHVHLEDIAPSRLHNHLIAGRGCLDFIDIFTGMSNLGYDGDISLELYPYVDIPV
ncbi:MAG: sugar phosphate isomerase/epimerase, partial [Syntrophales bacterium]|nr:sugar phosphate isomerase/epimerase [Syntrophales bacterium]